MDKLKKGLDAIRTLAAQTAWPQGTTPMAAESDGSEGFWPAGFSSAAVESSIRYSGRSDLMLLVSREPATAAGVFTTNRCCAAPVVLSREAVAANPEAMRAIVCNSGNANAATGARGMDDARAMAAMTADALGIDPGSVIVSSTGVIGELLPMEKVGAGIAALPAALQPSSGLDAAMAIMTTDTFPKFFHLTVALSGGTARISGIAKGSGMIHPNMATMLSFLATDASLSPTLLGELLSAANEKSFNAITVDGDTSTNDMAVLLAGGSGPAVKPGSRDAELFGEALEALMTFLAKLIVIDGEGATKLVEVRIEGARSDADARLAAMTIAQSSLVKTAIHGEDANWGRIIAAAGRSGAEFREEELELFFDDLAILKRGLDADFSEEEAAEVLRRPSYAITLRLGDGEGSAKVWTCDLSKEYVEINGSYRS